MSSGLYVHRPGDLGGITVVPVAQRPATRQPADIWHDLTHEMATVRALTAAALEASDETSRRAMLMLIEAEAEQVSGLLRQLRADQRVQDEAAEPAFVPAALTELVRTVAPTTRTELRVSGQLPALRIGIERISLRRVLRNLLENAIRAAGDNGVVELSAVAVDNGLAVVVADSGPGFGLGPPGLASRGLTIVRTLVAAAGGRVEVGTADLGGARVTVTFPVAHLN
ncbi:sensor histidine kinase [Kribbella sp. CA-253562]|uniref:sensor histidine kinase n=1 Tax=Kribbella sp. CA-253562 TaxID=3239942 RepID=UPI003D8A303D